MSAPEPRDSIEPANPCRVRAADSGALHDNRPDAVNAALQTAHKRGRWLTDRL